MKFLSVSKHIYLSLKLDTIHQNESRGMFGFQNRVPEVYKPNIHAKRCNCAYIEKCTF